ncbi:hypothetical protein DL95DRAFT_418455 [Leptodontidium sp. 2 PMI_412]|nr:hypothetical protein DL95DRAFT_418455 [Leptodontidium sp. 2 PMI_412]
MHHPSSRIFSLFFVPLSLVCGISQASQICTLSPGFAAPNRTDFRLCHDKISNLTTEARNNTGCFDDPPDGVLTVDGCYAMCGGGVDYWEWKDLFNRLSLLVLPTVFLIADLGFPPLGWHIFLIVPIQAIGNPIGRFQSLLIRFTTHRSYRRLAEAQSQLISPNSPQFFAFYKSLATVFSAYEEFGWQNVAATGNWLVTFSDQEQRIVTRASYRLSSLRVRSKVLPIVAIATLVGTLVVAIFRTIQQIDRSNTRITNETAHTIAVVCILYITIPQVWFGARIGIFTTDAEAIHILENMRDELERLEVPNNRNRPLLPPLQFAVCQGHKVGRYNSCWCRSSFHDFVMIFGYKPPEWERAKFLWRIIPSIGLGINLALIMWVEFALWDGDSWLGRSPSLFVWNRNGWLRYVPSFAIRSGTPLCKNEKEMEAEWNQLRAFPPPPAREGNAEEQGVEMSVLAAPVPAEHEQMRLLGGWPVAD